MWEPRPRNAQSQGQMQDRGPPPKGRYCHRLRPFDRWGLNRSGSEALRVFPEHRVTVQRVDTDLDSA